MNIKRKLLFLIIGLFMTFLLPNYAMASLEGNVPDGAKTHAGSRVNVCYKKDDGSFVTMNISTRRLKGQKLHDGDEYLINNKCGATTPTLQCPSGKVYNKTSNSCITPATGNVDAPTILDDNGELLDFSAPVLISGTAKAVNAVYKYDNVITINGIQVDALIKITGATSSSVTTFDRNDPNGGSPYKVSSGKDISDKAFFAPEITTTAAQGRVDFLISFQDISGNPVTLLNVYGNTIDIDGMGNIGQSEFVEYGGFVSYELASNTDLTAQIGSDEIKRKFVGKGGYGGLTLNDIGRVQTKFDSISILEISMGSTWKSGLRLYGSAFVKHNLASPVTHTPPTVNSQSTTNTKPPITGGKGSSATISSIAVKNSADITSTLTGSFTYPTTTTWTFTPSTALVADVYDVIATGSNGLVDQSDDELTILLTCTLPNVINAAGTACVPPIVCTLPAVRDAATNTCITPTPETCPTLEAVSANIPSYALSDNGKKVTICHLTSSKTNPFNVITISTNALDTHLNNHGDYFSKSGACPTDAVPCPPIVCTLPYVTNAAGDACVIQDVKPTVTLGQTATDYAVPVITGGVFGTSSTLTITVKNSTTNVISTIGTATKTSANGWTVTGTTKLPAGTYDVIATGDSGLVDETSNELTVSAGVIPTVTPGQKATDYEMPVITGTFGTSTSLIITVKNAANAITTIGTVTKGASDSWTVTGTTKLPAGTYDVIATGDVAHGGLVDNTPNELIVSAGVIPTVTLGQKATDYEMPVITGTFGTSTSLIITVKNASNVITTIGTVTKGASDNWTVTGTVKLAAGTYDVIATGDAAHGGLVDNTPNELTVSAGVIPTVANKTTTDKVAVPLTGTAGSSTSLIITVKNASNAVVATSTTITPTGNNWTYTPPVLPIGTYNVVATGDAAHGSLVDTSSGELVVSAAPIPTVTAMAPTTDTTPVIAGTVGTVGLSAGEAFSVKVNNVTYNNGNAALVITTTNWTLTIPTALNVGKYDVDAVRGTGAAAVPDGSSQELEIIGTRPTVENINQVTNDTTPVITGGFGNTDLGANEAFSVTVNGVIYNKGDGNLVALNSLWTLTIPPANALKVGDYEVKAVRNLTLEDLSSNELHIVIKAPTVESQTVRERLPIVIKGTVSDVGLDATSTFTVLVNAKTYTYNTDAALAVSGMNWTLTIPTTEVFPPTTYEVVATRDGTLVDGSTGELIVTPLSPPTVISQTTFDTTPIIKGTIGDAALNTGEVFTVLVNGKTYTKGVDANLVVTGLDWTLTILTGSEITGSATPYPVVASRTLLADTKTGTGDLTISPCLLPKVVNAAGTECIDPTPTVVSQTLSTASTVTPTITGTVGEVILGSTETFAVKVNEKFYAKGNTALAIVGMNWTLTIPETDAIPVGIYDVEALRNNVSKDKTVGELIVNLVCVAPQVPSTTRTNCVLDTTFPSADFLSTDDTTPVVTGKVGDVALDGSEDFTVEINGVVYQKSQLTISGLTWSLDISLANKLASATYDVVVTRNGVDKDRTSNELTITPCNSPKRIDANTGDCSEISLVPTVTPSASHNIKDPSIVVAGTVGDGELTTTERENNSFTVTVTEHGNSSNSLTGALLVSGMNWTFQITTPKVGTFDVNAVRGTKADVTDSELVITGNLCCISGTTTQCPTTISVPNHAGECGLPICPDKNAAGNCTSPLPDPTKEETLPSPPENKVPEAIVPPAELGYCDDGGKRSYGASMTGVTIKRARIANAETIGGTFASNALVGMKVMFGTLTAGSYDDSDNSCQQGYCTNKTITGATLTGVSVDIATDYVDAVGNVIDNNNRGIALTGGVTNPTSLKKDGVTELYATITNGMITAGTSDGNPVRGSITNGLFADAITHGASALTKGRRTTGTLTDATITGATITTVNGVSVVGCDRSLDSTHTPCTVGVITSGTMDSTGVKTFGTVENGTLTNATITGSNHCFSSGTVGSKGQLNWKEVIK